MLTQLSTTTCGVTTAASFVNITTTTVTSSLVASTSTVSSTTDNPIATPKLQNNGLAPTVPGSVKGKRKKGKAGNTASELVTQKKAKFQVGKEKVVIVEPESVEISISSSSAPQNTATQPKRSRKQQIEPLREVFEDVTAPSVKRPTKRKGATKKREVKDSSSTSAKRVKPSTKKSKGKANVKVASSATTTPVPISKPKIVLNRSFKVDPNLSFTIVPDTTRNISAIGPLQCVVAAETLNEPGKTADLENNVDVKEGVSTISGLKKNLFSKYLCAPHFVPLTDLWNSGQSLTRIVKFSSLEQYTGGKQQDNAVNVYRFSGSIYEKQLQDSDPPIQSYPERTLVIKHPVFGFYSRNFVHFRFLILKRINHNGHIIAVPKVKVVKLKRSTDLVNVELFVEEENFKGKISDVSEMNERNIQPVIHTPNAGLIPLLPTRTSQTVQLTPPQDQPHQSFQYVRYEYQTASELVPVEETSNSLVISGNNFQNPIQGIFPQVNRHTAGIEEVGGQTQIILLPAADFLQPESHNQQQIIFQPQDSGYVTEQVSLLQPAQQQPQVQYHIQHQPSTPHIQVQQLQQQTQSDGVYSELLLPGHTTPLRVRIQQRPEGQPLQIVRNPFSNSQQVIVQQTQQQYINAPQIIRVESQSQQQFVSNRSSVTGTQYHAVTSGQQSVIVRTPPPSQNHPIKLTQQQQVQLQQQLQQQHQIQQQHQSQQKQGEAPQQQVNQTFHPSQIDQSQQIRNQQGFQAQTQVQVQGQGQPQPLQKQIRVEQQSQPQQAPLQIPQVYQPSRLQQPQIVSQYQTPTIGSAQVQGHKTQVSLSQVPQASSQQPNFAGQQPPIQNNIGTLPGSSYPSQTTQSQFQQPTQPLPLEPPAKQKSSRTKQPKGKKGAAVNTLQHTQTPLSPNRIPQQTRNNQAVSSPQTVNTFTSAAGPASLVRVATVSPCSTSENSGAPKSFSSLPFSRVPANVISEPGKRTVLIVNSSKTPISSTGALAKPSVTDRPTRKPGFLAVCPHCGLCNKSVIKCNRCRNEFPEDVKLIKDVWFLNKSEAAVAVTASTITTTASTIKSDSAVEVSSPVLNNKAGVLTVKKGGPSKTQKKIVLVKTSSLVDSAVNNNNIKSVIKPGTATVQVHIQPDGGNSATLFNSSVGPLAAQKKAVTAPKKRAPPRKKQQECITLSSDEEEPQPPKPKVYKLEESSNSTVASTTVAVPLSPLQQTTQSLKSPASSTSQKTPTVGLNLNSVSNSVSHPNEDMGKKQLKVNVSAEVDIKPAKPEPSTEPPAVLEQIEKLIAEQGGKFQYASVKARSVRVGTYKITTSDYQVHDIVVTLSELGITFSLPHACYRHKKIKICIPKESILQMRISNQSRLAVIFIDTGPKYAKWIRNALGMDGNPENQSTNYYCPLNGGPGQKNITILGDEPFPPADYGSIKAMFRSVLEEVNYQTANNILMQITPQSFKSCISYKTESSTTSSSDSSPTGPMIVSTKSMALESKSVTSAVAVKRDSAGAAVTTAQQSSQEDLVNSVVVSSQSASNNSEQDPEGVVLFYEGRNNNKVAVTPQDIRCLGYSQFLNDQIIDFWLAVIQTEILSEEDQKRTFVFDSFFYSKLTEKIKKRTADEATMSAGERRHARVKKRTKNVDIFEKDFLIVPINENYHWFLAIICFAGLEGFHDYDTLAPLPDYKGAVKPKATKANAAKKKAIVYNQPQNQSTASFSNRDEAPADPEEDGEQSQDTNEEGPKTPNVNETESKNANHQVPASTPASAPVEKVGVQTRTDSHRRVKHPCILIFDSLAGEARGRIFSTLREYLKVEYKTKKNRERLFDKLAIPGCMPKVPQQPNFSDCGLFMLQYVESFFTNPPESFETSVINLKNWFPSSIAENKRKEIYNFIVKKTEEKNPQHVCRIPEVSFEPDPNDLMNEEQEMMHSIGTDDTFDEDESSSEEEYFEAIRVKKKKKSDDDKDHSYSVVSTTSTATTPRPTFIAVVKRE